MTGLTIENSNEHPPTTLNGNGFTLKPNTSMAIRDLVKGILNERRTEELQAYEQSLTAKKLPWNTLKAGGRSRVELFRIFSNLGQELEMLDMKVDNETPHSNERRVNLSDIKKKVDSVTGQFGSNYIPPQERLLATHAFAHMQLSQLYKNLDNIYQLELQVLELSDLQKNLNTDYEMIDSFNKYRNIEKELRSWPVESAVTGADGVKTVSKTIKDYSWKANVMAAYNMVTKHTGFLTKAINGGDLYVLYGGVPSPGYKKMIDSEEEKIRGFIRGGRRSKQNTGWKALSFWYIVDDYSRMMKTDAYDSNVV